MSDYYANVKTGDTLMVLKTHGHRSSFELAQWTAVTVTKDTKVFFWVGDDKHRKDGNAPYSRGWGSTKLFIPGTDTVCGVVPDTSTPAGQVETFLALYNRLWEVKRQVDGSNFGYKVSTLKSLEQAVHFNEKYLELYNELLQELDKQGGT